MTYENKKKNLFLNLLGIMLVLSPLPYGSVGKLAQPVFYLILCGILLVGIQAVQEKDRLEQKEIQKNESLNLREKSIKFLLYSRAGSARQSPDRKLLKGWEWAALFWSGFMLFILFQLLPLPGPVLKIISPGTWKVLKQLGTLESGWHCISLVPQQTLEFGFRFMVLSFIGLVIARLNPRWRDLVKLVRYLEITLVFQAGLGLLRVFSGSSRFFLFFGPVIKDSAKNELTGTLFNSNHSAFFMEAVFFVVLGFLLKLLNENRQGRHGPGAWMAAFENNSRAWFKMLVLILAATGIVMSGSRAGMVAVIIGFILCAGLLVMKELSGQLKVLRIIIPLLIVITLSVGGKSTFSHFQKLEQKSPDHIGRFIRWPASLQLFTSFPVFGTGMGTFRYAYFLVDREGNQWVTHAHNDMLETLTDSGVIGTVLFFGFLAALFRGMYRLWKKRNRTRVVICGAGVIAALGVMAFHSFFDFSLRIPFNSLVLAVIVGTGMGIINYKKNNSPGSRER